MAIIYLSGPIADVTKEEASGWRNQAAEFLADKGHKALDPLRRKNRDYRSIVEHDLNDVEKSDITLAYVPMGRQMIGTSMEIFYANRILRRTVIVWGHHCKDTHPWIFQNAKHIFLPLEDALDYIASNIKP